MRVDQPAAKGNTFSSLDNSFNREEKSELFRQETMTRWEEFCRTGESVPNKTVMGWIETWGSANNREDRK